MNAEGNAAGDGAGDAAGNEAMVHIFHTPPHSPVRAPPSQKSIYTRAKKRQQELFHADLPEMDAQEYDLALLAGDLTAGAVGMVAQAFPESAWRCGQDLQMQDADEMEDAELEMILGLRDGDPLGDACDIERLLQAMDEEE